MLRRSPIVASTDHHDCALYRCLLGAKRRKTTPQEPRRAGKNKPLRATRIQNNSLLKRLRAQSHPPKRLRAQSHPPKRLRAQSKSPRRATLMKLALRNPWVFSSLIWRRSKDLALTPTRVELQFRRTLPTAWTQAIATNGERPPGTIQSSDFKLFFNATGSSRRTPMATRLSITARR